MLSAKTLKLLLDGPDPTLISAGLRKLGDRLLHQVLEQDYILIRFAAYRVGRKIDRDAMISADLIEAPEIQF